MTRAPAAPVVILLLAAVASLPSRAEDLPADAERALRHALGECRDGGHDDRGRDGGTCLQEGGTPDGGVRSPAANVREASRAVTDRCAAAVVDGTSVNVDRSFKTICKKDPGGDASKDIYHGDSYRYSVARKGPGFRVEARIELELKPAGLSAARQKLLVDRTRECGPIINQYWNRYGITLDLVYTTPKAGTAVAANASRVTVHDGTGRSNARYFYFQGLDNEQKLPTGQTMKSGPAQLCLQACRQATSLLGGGGQGCVDMCEPVRQREYCTMLVHEFGHRLGLPDEYADPSCPDRDNVSKETYPWSIMAVPWMGFVDTPDALTGFGGVDSGLVEFFPRHIESVLGPICPAP